MTKKEILRLQRLTEDIYCVIKLRKTVRSAEDQEIVNCITHSIIGKNGVFHGRILNVSGNQTWIELEYTKMEVVIPTNFIEFAFPLYCYKDKYNKIAQEIAKEDEWINQEEAQCL